MFLSGIEMGANYVAPTFCLEHAIGALVKLQFAK